LKKRPQLELRDNLGVVSQSQMVAQANGQRLGAIALPVGQMFGGPAPDPFDIPNTLTSNYLMAEFECPTNAT